MAISIDWGTLTIKVPQGDLTPVTGSLYELDTENTFRQSVNSLMAGEEGIVFEDSIRHNTEVTVAGTTFARTIEIINGYNVEFTPDSQYSVRLAGSNNNLFDVENSILVQNQVQIIAQNSAGLIVLETVTSGLAPDESAALAAITLRVRELWKLKGLDITDPMTVTPTSRSTQSGDITQTISGDGVTTSTVTRT